jgi:hypothetical protein
MISDKSFEILSNLTNFSNLTHNLRLFESSIDDVDENWGRSVGN